MVLEVAALFFQELGFVIKAASTVEHAVQAAAASPIDVLFIECEFSKTEIGLKLIQNLRFRHPHLPVIHATGNDLDAFSSFIDPVVLKPYSLATLQEALQLATKITAVKLSDKRPSAVN